MPETADLLLRGMPHGVSVTPATAGWTYISFQTRSLSSGERIDERRAEEEIAIVPLSGQVLVAVGSDEWTVGGRTSVFDGLPEAVYLPRDTEFGLTALNDGAEVAFCSSLSERDDLEPMLISKGDYPVELRGEGHASRQVATLLPPEFAADRLILVEVWTPAGNWSCFPPHRHDRSNPPEEIVLEETFYFRTPAADGFGSAHLYSASHAIDHAWTVYDGDLLIVPFGFHTMSAGPRQHLYYLNVLAGERRGLTAFQDPAHIGPPLEGAGRHPSLPIVAD
jgi:5-deoxy-glucuronate isomerase